MTGFNFFPPDHGEQKYPYLCGSCRCEFLVTIAQMTHHWREEMQIEAEIEHGASVAAGRAEAAAGL